MTADQLDPLTDLPGPGTAPGQRLDAGQEVGPSRRVGLVVGPHVPLEVEPVAGGRLTDPLVGRQLVGVIRGLEALKRRPQRRLGLGEQGQRLLDGSPPALAVRHEHQRLGDRLEAAAHLVEERNAARLRVVGGIEPVVAVRQPIGPAGDLRVRRLVLDRGAGLFERPSLAIRRPACRLGFRPAAGLDPGEVRFGTDRLGRGSRPLARGGLPTAEGQFLQRLGLLRGSVLGVLGRGRFVGTIVVRSPGIRGHGGAPSGLGISPRGYRPFDRAGR